jgi:hypothetical protein
MGTLFHLSDCNEQIGKTASAWAGCDVASLADAARQPERAALARERADAWTRLSSSPSSRAAGSRSPSARRADRPRLWGSPAGRSATHHCSDRPGEAAMRSGPSMPERAHGHDRAAGSAAAPPPLRRQAGAHPERTAAGSQLSSAGDHRVRRGGCGRRHGRHHRRALLENAASAKGIACGFCRAQPRRTSTRRKTGLGCNALGVAVLDWASASAGCSSVVVRSGPEATSVGRALLTGFGAWKGF